MSEILTFEPGFEPERYEQREGAAYHFEMTRRDLLKTLGAGILVLCLAPEALSQEGGRRGGGFRSAGGPQQIGAWLHIGEEGEVTAFTGKVELGQGARTELSLVVAEELRAPLSSIRMVMGDTDLTPFDQGTHGSQTTPNMVPQLRRAAAAAREMLAQVAAERWKVDRAQVVTSDGKATCSQAGKSAGYGELANGEMRTHVIGPEAALTPVSEWKVAGKPALRINGRDVVTGALKFAADVKRPGMIYGRMVRPEAQNAKLISIDTSAAEAMPGVIVVKDGDFVGVAAPTPAAADRAVASIKAEWKSDSQGSSKDLFARLRGGSQGGQTLHAEGAVADGLAAAEVKLKHTYTVEYIAHAPMEPRAAVAEWEGDKVTVWACTQSPFGMKSGVVGALRVPESQVRVIAMETGGGFGGKQSAEYAVEAARLSRAAGKPVHVAWTREEEFQWAYFRPSGVIDVASGVRKDGKLTAWEFHNYNSGTAGIRGTYDVAAQGVQFHGSDSPMRQGSYRSLAACANHFARETHMNELAHAVGMDPLAFRLKNLTDERQRGVLQAAAEKFGWGQRKPSRGHGFGIACGFDKGGYVATCVEIALDRPTGPVRVLRATTAFDCGPAINPENLRNQIEGAQMMGIGGALHEAIQFENGKVLNPAFSAYRVPRMMDAPVFETIIMNTKDAPIAGAGETPIVAIAPAINDAIFQITGIRLRALPMTPDGKVPKATA